MIHFFLLSVHNIWKTIKAISIEVLKLYYNFCSFTNPAEVSLQYKHLFKLTYLLAYFVCEIVHSLVES